MFHSVFCRSDGPLPREELEEWIWEGVFFEEEPRYEPPADPGARSGDDWAVLDAHYAEGKRPVQFIRYRDARIQEFVEEAIGQLEERGHATPELNERLRETRQLFSIEIDELHATEDAWEMLDTIEARIAGHLDGLIYSYDEGFFDDHNRPVARWGTR